MIYLKNQKDLIGIRKAADIWKQTRAILLQNAVVDVSLVTLDELAKTTIESLGGTCSFYQCYGFPKNICISVNDQLIHGIPNSYKIKPKDLIKFDVGVTCNGYICDAAFTKIIGPITKAAKHINDICQLALNESIKLIKPNNYIGDIANCIETIANQNGYEVIKDFGGHGCGLHVHEDPIILNYGEPKTGTKILKNMVLCIEPMIMTGSDRYYIDPKNNWTVISKNHELTCHCEHMVLVTEDGCEVLTN